jgi:glutathione S-transferase
MKLYYKPGACSLSPHIALREAGIDVELVRVDTKAQTTADGQDYTKINPYGYVPALEIKGGEILTEGPAIVQYIADLVPGNTLAPMNGSLERTRVQSALAFIGTELHKSIGALFNPKLDEAGRKTVVDKVDLRLGQLAKQMDGKDYIANNIFSVADIYLFVVLSWLAPVKVDIAQWPVLQQFSARIAARPAVQAALQAEGLT